MPTLLGFQQGLQVPSTRALPIVPSDSSMGAGAMTTPEVRQGDPHYKAPQGSTGRGRAGKTGHQGGRGAGSSQNLSIHVPVNLDVKPRHTSGSAGRSLQLGVPPSQVGLLVNSRLSQLVCTWYHLAAVAVPLQSEERPTLPPTGTVLSCAGTVSPLGFRWGREGTLILQLSSSSAEGPAEHLVTGFWL
jgi:hypothetical protein